MRTLERREMRQPLPSVWERFPELKKIPENKFPYHLFIIPDGNGRFAKLSSMSPVFGHKKGAEVLKDVMRDLRKLPIHIVTIWGFSTDNWKRSPEEIREIMDTLKTTIEQTLPELLENNVRLVHLGRKDRIPISLRGTIEKAEKQTAGSTDKILALAIDFGGEDQETRVAQQIARAAIEKKLTPEQITPGLLKGLRDGGGLIPSADLIIRTSGELRTSDVGWLNGKNTELYVIRKLLPETRTEDFVKALISFSQRDRRFGGRPNQK